MYNQLKQIFFISKIIFNFAKISSPNILYKILDQYKQ
jgi:hypothetical protein